MRTGEAARQFNRTGAWLRGLERAGVIPPAQRDFSGYRVYCEADIARIREVLESRQRG